MEYNLARLRVLGFARRLQRLRAAEGGDDATDEADETLTLELSDSYFAHRDRNPALFPDTVPCFDALRSQHRLGLLSNGSRPPEKVGLDGYFESVVFAQDHRVAKPDKGIFEIVEGQLGVPPGRCVLVGDHPLHDVVGAKRAGWPACGSTVTGMRTSTSATPRSGPTRWSARSASYRARSACSTAADGEGRPEVDEI